MQDSAAFIVDDDKLSFEPSVPTRETTIPPERVERHLSRLLQELETGGVLIACATSVVNHAYRYPHRSRRLIAALPLWLPPETFAHGGGNAWAFVAPRVRPIVNGLHDLSMRLGIARELTLRHCASVETALPLDPVAIDELAGLWGGICERALELLQDARAAMPLEEGHAGPIATAVAAERLLAAAALGASPCVNRNDTIEIPGWIERRSDRRHRLRLDCGLRVEQRVWQMRTMDISRQGAGLAGSPQLQPGMRAGLVIGRSPEIKGVVVWQVADRLGFRFDAPLSIADLGSRLARP